MSTNNVLLDSFMKSDITCRGIGLLNCNHFLDNQIFITPHVKVTWLFYGSVYRLLKYLSVLKVNRSGKIGNYDILYDFMISRSYVKRCKSDL